MLLFASRLPLILTFDTFTRCIGNGLLFIFLFSFPWLPYLLYLLKGTNNFYLGSNRVQIIIEKRIIKGIWKDKNVLQLRNIQKQYNKNNESFVLGYDSGLGYKKALIMDIIIRAFLFFKKKSNCFYYWLSLPSDYYLKNNRQNKCKRAGFVNILGRPNAGKSTLMNLLVGEKLSIITPKAQTTRHRILGILNREDCQVVFFRHARDPG